MEEYVIVKKMIIVVDTGIRPQTKSYVAIKMAHFGSFKLLVVTIGLMNRIITILRQTNKE